VAPKSAVNTSLRNMTELDMFLSSFFKTSSSK